MNPALSEKGMKQARTLAEALKDEPLSPIYTSTRERSIETARPGSRDHKMSLIKKAALMEIHLGVLQGRFRDVRDPEAQNLWATRSKNRLSYKVPEGETFFELEQRVTFCLQDILKKEAGGVVLIIGHRNTNRVILSALMGWSLADVVELGLRSKYLYEITLGEAPAIQTICLSGDKKGTKSDSFKV